MISFEELNNIEINVDTLFNAFLRLFNEYEEMRNNPSAPVNDFNEVIIEKFDLLHEKMDLLGREEKEQLVEMFVAYSSKNNNPDLIIACFNESVCLSVRMNVGISK